MSEKLIKEIEDDEIDADASVQASGRCSAAEIARNNSMQSVQTASNSMPIPTTTGKDSNNIEGNETGSRTGSGTGSGIGTGSGSGNGTSNGTGTFNGTSNPRISIDSGKDSGK